MKIRKRSMSLGSIGCLVGAVAGGCSGAEPLTSSEPLTNRGPLESVSAAAPVCQQRRPPVEGVVMTQYQLPPVLDPEVTAGFVRPVDTELWAALYRPATLSAGKKYPLIALVHGAHNSCRTLDANGCETDAGIGEESDEYADGGVCPQGSTRLPNHLGYDYLADELVRRGYYVLSLNSSRNTARLAAVDRIAVRGRLLLRHLERLARWDRQPETLSHDVDEAIAGDHRPDIPADIREDMQQALPTSFKGQIDFTQIGLMGHSQGGEAVRLAYHEFRADGSPWPERILGADEARRLSSAGETPFRGIFEIGPTDRQSERELNGDGTRWAVLVPGCDTDVRDWPGLQVFQRMLTDANVKKEHTPAFKAFYLVYGANHEAYNSEWSFKLTRDDNPRAREICWSSQYPYGNQKPIYGIRKDGVLQTALQQRTAVDAVVPFFVANVGADRSVDDKQGNRLFDPQYGQELLRDQLRVNLEWGPGSTATPNPDDPGGAYRVHRGYHTGGDANASLALCDFVRDPERSYEASGVAVSVAAEEAVDLEMPWADPPNGPWRCVQDSADDEYYPGEKEVSFFQANLATDGRGSGDLSRHQFLDFRVALQNPYDCAQDFVTHNFFTIRLVGRDGRLSQRVRSDRRQCGSQRSCSGYVDLVPPPRNDSVLQTARIPLAEFKDVDLTSIAGVRFEFTDRTIQRLSFANIRATQDASKR